MLRALFRLANGVYQLEGITVGNGDLIGTNHCGFFTDKHLPPAIIYVPVGSFTISRVEIQTKLTDFTHNNVLIQQDFAKIFLVGMACKNLLSAVFVDNSSSFRLDPDVPLIIPEVNGADAFRNKGIISNPNCSTIITLMAVAALHQISPIEAMTACTYQAVSGAGQAGLQELENQNGKPAAVTTMPEPEDQMSMLDLRSQQVCAALEAISIETLTPIEAMNELYRIKKMLN